MLKSGKYWFLPTFGSRHPLRSFLISLKNIYNILNICYAVLSTGVHVVKYNIKYKDYF